MAASMVFFDLDDTLLDHRSSERAGVTAFHRVYRGEIQFDDKAFYGQWLSTTDKYFRMYLAGEMTFERQRLERIKELFALSGVSLSEESARERFSVYLQEYEKNWKLFDDVLPCLESLSGCRLGIISNGDPRQQSEKLEKLGIRDRFELIVTAGETGIAKPDARLLNVACARAGAQPEKCFYVGDDLETDILPCKENGMHGIWLNRNKKPLIAPDVTAIHSLNELKSILSTYLV